MRTILVLLRKEFTQIFRNKTMLPIIFVLPIVQLVILISAATQEMQEIKIGYVDFDKSESSRALISKFQAAPFYRSIGFYDNTKLAEEQLFKDNIDMFIVFPVNFEKELYNNLTTEVQLLINAINGTTASLMNAYSQNIIQTYNSDIIVDFVSSRQLSSKQINITEAFWYNPKLNYKHYMLPGILVILVTVVGMFLTAINLVREKELGTIEQINVTPIKKYEFLVSKLIPFWLIALFELAFGLTIGKIFFALPILGNLWVLFLFAAVYLFLALGLGLLLSTISQTQQQVMFIAFFFIMIFIFMSGLFTPAESMPVWAQKANYFNPLAYFIKVIRMVLLKGSELSDIKNELIIMLCYGSGVLGFAVWKYRKVS